MKKLFYGICIPAILILLVAGYIGYKIKEKHDYTGILEVKSNVPLRESLSALPLAKDPIFRLYLKYAKNGGKNIKAGYYEFKKPMDMTELIDFLEKGLDKAFKITIPEGYTIEQIVEVLDSQKRIDKEKFYYELETFTGFPYKTPNSNFEGYFYPETYFIPENADEKMIINTFLNEFLKKFPPEKYPDKDEFYKKLIMASILEREAKLDKEKPLMAGVFYNRLKIGMHLASDATVNYAFKFMKRSMNYADVKVDSPYNTYKNFGLPPGPICNPTVISMKAAYEPEDTPYLFFVAKGDGSHFFSKTYREHLNFQNSNRNKK